MNDVSPLVCKAQWHGQTVTAERDELGTTVETDGRARSKIIHHRLANSADTFRMFVYVGHSQHFESWSIDVSWQWTSLVYLTDAAINRCEPDFSLMYSTVPIQISEWKFRNFSGLFKTWCTKQSAPTFTPFRTSTYEFDTKTRHYETICRLPKIKITNHRWVFSKAFDLALATKSDTKCSKWQMLLV